MTLEEILAQLEQIESLDTASLEELEAAIVALYQEVRGADDLSEEDVAALEELATARRAVQAQIAANAAGDAEQAERLANLDAEMLGEGEEGDGDGDDAGDDADAGDAGEGGSGDDAGDGGDGDDAGGDDAGDGDDDGDEDDDATDRERELVTAGGTPTLNRAARRRLESMQRRQPRAQREPATFGQDVVVAAAGVPNIRAGARIQNAEQFGAALAAQHEAIGPFQGRPGEPFQKFPVLTVRRDFAADLTIRERDSAERVNEVMDLAVQRHLAAIDQQVATMGDDVVLAAGGPCVAAEPDYRVDFVGSDTRPFSTAFPTVRYPRGRVSFYPPLCFDGSDADTTYAQIGRSITAAEDLAGYTADGAGATVAFKGCVRINCPDPVPCGLDILIKCITIGNWVDRTFPEYVRAWQQLIDVYYARAYEQKHIAQVVAGSTIVTDSGSPFGAALSFTSAILRVIAHTNSARREPNRMWRLQIPSWAIALLKIDLMRYLNATSNGLAGLNVTDAQVIALLRNVGVNVSTYVDESGPTTQSDAQLLAALSTGAVPDLPTSVRAFLYPEGQWVRGTGGELSTGVIRDSSLVQANDFQTFVEEWTSMCQRGCAGDSFVLDAALCPNGVSGGTVVMDCFSESPGS